MFIDAPGGTGKTYLFNAILCATRTLNDEANVALAVAYSGIAATLLLKGRTFHSRFKAPIRDLEITKMLDIKYEDSTAEVYIKLTLI